MIEAIVVLLALSISATLAQDVFHYGHTMLRARTAESQRGRIIVASAETLDDVENTA